MERRIREITQQTIDAFYCRKIRIASNIREQWCEKFEVEHGEEQRWRINMCLCMSGPCVEQYLRGNEVEVDEDWICKIM